MAGTNLPLCATPTVLVTGVFNDSFWYLVILELLTHQNTCKFLLSPVITLYSNRWVWMYCSQIQSFPFMLTWSISTSLQKNKNKMKNCNESSRFMSVLHRTWCVFVRDGTSWDRRDIVASVSVYSVHKPHETPSLKCTNSPEPHVNFGSQSVCCKQYKNIIDPSKHRTSQHHSIFHPNDELRCHQVVS